MLRPLSVIRRRVDRLATQARTGSCDGHHRRHRWVTVSGSEPVPAWPEQEQGERCACGAELEYFTIVDILHMEPHPDRRPHGGHHAGLTEGDSSQGGAHRGRT